MAECNKITIPEGYEPLIEQYELYLNAQNLSKNTIVSYTVQFKKLIFTLEALDLVENPETEIDNSEAKQKQNLQKAIEIVLSHSPNSPGVVRSAFRNILNFMKVKKGVDINGIDVPKHKGRRTREVHKCPNDYINKMLPLLKREDDNLMVRITRKFALRSEDATMLRVSSFNFARKKLKIIGKGNTEVIKPMVDDAFISVIRTYIKYRLPKYDSEDRSAKIDFMFPRIAKLKHPTRHFRYIMEFVGKQLEDKYCVHEIRHGAATDLYNAGMELRVLQKFMGHKSIASTAIYAEPSDETVMEQIVRAERKINGDDVVPLVNLSDNVVKKELKMSENINEESNS